jgi:hypothetical protein
MDRVERQFYPNGTLKEEIHYRDGKKHGVWRTWHPNGAPDLELSFENGEFADGIARIWDQAGWLRSEESLQNGRALGRMTIYNEDGSIFHRHYMLENGVVSRAAYDKACKTRPELPKYTDPDPPKERRTSARQMTKSAPDPGAHEADRAFVRKMLEKPHAEALSWLKEGSEGSMRTLGEMGRAPSERLVSKLYKLGAVKVLAAEIDPGDNGQSTDHLLVELPQDPKARAKLFKFESQHAESEGFDPTPDIGQEYIYFKL